MLNKQGRDHSCKVKLLRCVFFSMISKKTKAALARPFSTHTDQCHDSQLDSLQNFSLMTSCLPNSGNTNSHQYKTNTQTSPGPSRSQASSCFSLKQLFLSQWCFNKQYSVVISAFTFHMHSTSTGHYQQHHNPQHDIHQDIAEVRPVGRQPSQHRLRPRLLIREPPGQGEDTRQRLRSDLVAAVCRNSRKAA